MHDYSAFKEETSDGSRPTAKNCTGVGRNANNCGGQMLMTLEAQLKEAKNGLKELNSHRIPALMDSLGIGGLHNVGRCKSHGSRKSFSGSHPANRILRKQFPG